MRRAADRQAQRRDDGRAAAALRASRPALLVLLLAGCGGRPTAPPPPPEPDRALLGLAQAGRVALEADRGGEAERQYRNALTRARERDDPLAIGETGTGLAAALLAEGRPREALAATGEVTAELARRGAAAPPGLGLAAAIARYRLGDLAGAEAEAVAAAARGAEDAGAARRAWFLRGLVAADRGDAAGLTAARAALGPVEGSAANPTAGPAASLAIRGDAAELEARTALLAGDAAAAGLAAMRAAAARREELDYRGLSRALALGAEAAERRGETAIAADLFLRAGRGAASRLEREPARRWLNRAQALGRRAGRPAVVEAARTALAGLRSE